MSNKINRDKLITSFITNFPELYIDMKKSKHYVNILDLNPFHGEGSVWVHTMMVMTWIEAKYCENYNDDYIILLTTAMLHDIGKPICEGAVEASDTKPIRNSFKGNEGVYVMKCISIIKKL